VLSLRCPPPRRARHRDRPRLRGEELPAPSCPTGLLRISRTPATRQGRHEPRPHGARERPHRRWTIRLSKPGPKQITFFNERLGGVSQAGITVLKPGKRLFGRVVAQSPINQLEPFFGQTVQFPLERSLPIKKGQVLGLTVPTWAPALATGLGNDTSWRASRRAGDCEDTSTQTAQMEIRDLAQYRCLYQKVRLSYSATMITEPRPNNPPRDSTGTNRGD
jgi:hypothetical protein